MKESNLPVCGVWRLVSLQIRFGDSLESEAVILCSRPGSGGGDSRNAAKGATGDRRAGSVPLASGSDHRFAARAGEVGASDRLALPGREVWRGLHGQAGSSAAADASDGWAFRPQAHARPRRRGVVRALGREPVLPVFLRRRVLPAPAGVRPLLADTLAPAHGGGEARCSAAGERGLGPPAPRGVSRPIWPASLSTPPFSPRQ